VIMMAAAHAVQQLTRVALNQDRPGTIEDLIEVVARSTESQGAVLWEAPDESQGDNTLSVVALWIDIPAPIRTRAVPADPITELSFATRSLAVPDNLAEMNPTIFSHPVNAALPINYNDGGHGVLSLLGADGFSAAAFETTVELVEILPDLCSAVRERQTLALVNACNSILHDADVESPGRPLSRERLGDHLSKVCNEVARALRCADVSIYLREPTDRASGYRRLSTSSGTAPGTWEFKGEPVDLVRSGLAPGSEPLMEVRLRHGGTVHGLLRCQGSTGPPHHFTTSDLAMLFPIAAQLGRYWRGWLQKRDIQDENAAWRGLAAGMTSLNKLLAQNLGREVRSGTDDQQVSEVAAEIIRQVVPESTGATVFRFPAEADIDSTLVPVALAGQEYRHDSASSASALTALRTGLQQHITDPEALAADELTPEVGWLLCTPIHIGEQRYGVLETVGQNARPPANSAQVHKIIADQIGLYNRLQDTLGHLYDVRQRLEIARRTEADAMEDLKHQLVSPLRTAASRAEFVLVGRRFDARAESQLKAIRGLCRKASRVAMSAGVFATLSQGGQPEPKLELFGRDDLLRTLIGVADDIQVLGDPRREIYFDVDRDSIRQLGRRLVQIDASFLQQCIGNVLDNAAKYAYTRTRVKIEARISPKTVAIVVTSTGLPMTKEDIAQCLQRNWRGDTARSTTGEGSGLGLWIVDNLMHAMSGRVVIRADFDQTRVSLVLPLT